MRIREYTGYWLKSALGVASALLALAAGAAAGIVAGGTVLGFLAAGLPAALLSFGVLYVACLATGLGSKAAFGESGRAERGKAGAGLVAMSEARQRLAALRLSDEAVAAARDLVVLQAGRFLETARAWNLKAPSKAGGTDDASPAWDPRAALALTEAMELLDAWLREADETAIERRFDAPDAHPFPDARERIMALLKEKAQIVAECLEGLGGRPAGPDAVAIQEETRL